MIAHAPTTSDLVLHESVENALQLYRPTERRAPHFDDYAEDCRDIIRKVTPLTPRGVVTMFSMLVQLAEWNIAQGVKPDFTKILRPENIDRFVLVGLKHLGDRSRATRLSTLRRLGPAGAPKWWRRGTPKDRHHPPLEPLPQKTLDSYFWSARLQRFPRHRRFFNALLLLGLGAGLKPVEIAVAKPSDLLYQNGYLAIRAGIAGQPSRVVPIRLEYADQLLALAFDHPNERFCGNFSVRINDPLGRTRTFIDMPAHLPPLNARRLRRTWMVSVLNDGIDLASFLTLAGAPDARSIGELLPFITPAHTATSWAAATGDNRG